MTKPSFPLRVWNFLTSFKLAVLVFAVSILLVFFGTLAQVHEGLYLAQERWFKSWFVVRQSGDVWWTPPVFPGGYLLGTIFLINMLGAHFRRFKFPPGGWLTLILHYLLVMAALFAITRYLLWTPMFFALSLLCLLGADFFLCMLGKKLPASGRKIGIDAVHLGIAVLLLGQLATDLFARETHLAFREGETKQYSESHQDIELAVCADVDAENETVVSIPQDLLTKPGATLTHEKLPFTVKVEQWQGNSDLVSREEATQSAATLNQALATLESKYSSVALLPAAAEAAQASPGRVLVWQEALKSVGVTAGEDLVATAKTISQDATKANTLLGELKQRFRREMTERFQSQGGSAAFAVQQIQDGAGFPEPQAKSPVAQRYFTITLPERRDMDARNIPAAVVSLTGRDGRDLSSWLLTPSLKEQTVSVDGRDYRLSLRFARAYHPFSMTLLKTTHEKYAGTDTPKDFRSKVRIQDKARHEDREVEIFMNSPLRFDQGNLTFYQSQMGRDAANANRGTSELQVVQNPGWFSPYFGCALVAYGMCRHFLLHLLRFISRKKSP